MIIEIHEIVDDYLGNKKRMRNKKLQNKRE